MQVHIWPSRTCSVAAANAAISVHASWVAWSVGAGTVWKWSYTQIDVHGPASAWRATPSMVSQWCAGSMPARSSRQPWGTKSPNCIVMGFTVRHVPAGHRMAPRPRSAEIDHRIEREPAQQLAGARLGLLGDTVGDRVLRLGRGAVGPGRGLGGLEHRHHEARDLVHLVRAHAERGERRRADPDAAGVPRAVRVARDAVPARADGRVP